MLDDLVFSPRAVLLFRTRDRSTQFRFSYGTGFRAPQAFDSDMHIAFAGGGVSRIVLADDLKEERSQSLSLSVNYDKAAERYIAGFTLEAFYTKLDNAFSLVQIDGDEYGDIFEKRNASSATVQGVTLEARMNYNKKVQIEGGFTLQTSQYGEAVEYITAVEPTRDFLRTPDMYGFATLSYMPTQRWALNLNYVYTGSMQALHMGGAVNFAQDAMVTTKSFNEVDFKLSYTFPIAATGNENELYGGVKNILDDYQSDFDIGKNRDSNYIYGTSMPRSLFVGLKIRM